jgi:tetratricopeptide (TPR) repeat protein
VFHGTTLFSYRIRTALRSSCALFVFGVGLVVAALAQGQPDGAAQAQVGVNAAQRGDYRAAIQAYKHAIAINSNLPGIYLNMGLAYFKLGSFREAIAAFEKENAKAPSERVQTLVAMSYFGLGQYAEAAKRLKPLASAQPGNTELVYLLAKCYVWSGQREEAMALFKQLLEHDPDAPAVHMLMGEALDADRRTGEAISEFEAAVKSNPMQPDVHFGLGYLYWKERRYEEAEREFRDELRTNPKNAPANAYLGDILMNSGHAKAAVPFLESAIALRSDLHIAHKDLAIIYTGDKQTEKAIREFREAIRTDPSNYDAHYRLARLYRELGRTAEADKEFAIVRTLHQKHTEEPLIKISGSSL